MGGYSIGVRPAKSSPSASKDETSFARFPPPREVARGSETRTGKSHPYWRKTIAPKKHPLIIPAAAGLPYFRTRYGSGWKVVSTIHAPFQKLHSIISLCRLRHVFYDG